MFILTPLVHVNCFINLNILKLNLSNRHYSTKIKILTNFSIFSIIQHKNVYTSRSRGESKYRLWTPPPENSINPRTLVWGKLTVDQCHIFSTIFTEVKYYNLLFLLMYLDDLNKKWNCISRLSIHTNLMCSKWQSFQSFLTLNYSWVQMSSLLPSFNTKYANISCLWILFIVKIPICVVYKTK